MVQISGIEQTLVHLNILGLASEFNSSTKRTCGDMGVSLTKTPLLDAQGCDICLLHSDGHGWNGWFVMQSHLEWCSAPTTKIETGRN